MKEDTYFLFVCYFISWLTIGLISAILCVVLYKFIYNLTQHTLAAFIGTMGYAFGTTAFAYSTILYAHQIAAACSFYRLLHPFCSKKTKRYIIFRAFFSAVY